MNIIEPSVAFRLGLHLSALEAHWEEFKSAEPISYANHKELFLDHIRFALNTWAPGVGDDLNEFAKHIDNADFFEAKAWLDDTIRNICSDQRQQHNKRDLKE